MGAISARAELKLPAATAYLSPTDGGARISRRDGITDWNNPAQKILWFGEITNAGKLSCSIKLRLPPETETRLRLTVAEQSREAAVKGAGNEATNIDFGAFEVTTGYQKFTLESLNGAGKDAGQINALVLDGSPIAGAHFNLNPRRNAASVHLAYPTPGFTNIDAFYCEITATETPLWTYFEAGGWHRGYFGMQVNSPTERRIIFSVWDSGNEAVDRNKVASENRVTLVAKGDGVDAGGFCNEGTGGHSHLVYGWKTGTKQRFLVTAKVVDGTHTIYSGYWFQPEQKKWVLISSWKAPKDGGYLHGLYSFCEDFGDGNGQVQRKALYGNQWFHTADGQWHEETSATFSCDPTGRNDRFDRFMGIEAGQFFLSTGGFVSGFTKF
ncbi:MAG TPA: DUF3472 domain-containing protein, partial [Candidatus Binatia bacterium]|nr:DUF3472 domain-containing protein [Candidatus Binatia bacterium]